MGSSLQDQLLKAGLISEEKLKKSERQKKPGAAKAGSARRPGNGTRRKKATRKTGARRPSRDGDMSLAAAYAQRRKAEKEKKEEDKRRRVADQEARRKRNLQLDKLVEDQSLNVETAEEARYFEHLGKIRRVMVTPEQLSQVNSGEIGVVSLRGRYLLVSPQVLAQYQALAPDLVPELSRPTVSEVEEAGFEVPDDLRW